MLNFKILAPLQAIAFFIQKGLHIGFDWRDTEKQMHDISFTAAKIMQLDILADIREEIKKAIQQGIPFEQFKKNLIPTLANKGWWGEKEVVDPETGELKTINVNPSRLQKIYNTNLKVAHSEGEWTAIQDSKKAFPYLRYLGCRSLKPRELHCSWNGLVLPVNDPFWMLHFPVKDYGCNCSTEQLTQREAEKEGISKAPDETYVEWTNDRTGKTQQVPYGVHPSFNSPPGTWQTRLDAALQEKNTALPKEWRK
jgi:uncharacterized protein with gpF-like domain